MSFISFDFLIFFSIVVPVYFATPFRLRWILLLAASYFFYAYWNLNYIILIIFSTLVDYFVARAIGNTPENQHKKHLLFLSASLVVNLGVLFTFKYYNWFSTSLTDGLMLLGFEVNLSSLEVLLPVGISFYTFQSMAYTIDVFRGKIEPEKHAGIFATYVAFFPQLVAGPIERAPNMLPQFWKRHDFDYDRVVSGLRLMLWGAFKKVVIADRIALYVNAVYNDVEIYTGISLILATFFFAFQIYCDFSGYSDIAIGAARIMGFDLMENFRQPYLSRSIREFWRRWHISLSTWFRDYVYIPLGGNRVSFGRNLLNLMIVFVVSGLWHGANWTFVIWGVLHGLFIIIEVVLDRFWGTDTTEKSVVHSWGRWLLTFSLVCIAWVFFRANTVEDAFYVLVNLFNFSAGFTGATAPFASGLFAPATEVLLSLGLISFIVIVEYFDWQAMTQKPILLRWGWYYAILISITVALYYGTVDSSFIYFQF